MDTSNEFNRMSFTEFVSALFSTRSGEIEEIYKAWFGVFTLLQKIREYASAVSMYSVVAMGAVTFPEHINSYLSLLEDAAENRLTSEIAELFDPAEMKGDKNCSIKLLKNCCERNEVFFQDGANDELVKRMNDLISDYNQSSIIRARNKQLSHHDFEQIFGNEPIEVSISEEYEIVERLTDIVIEIGKRLFPEGEPVYTSMNDSSESYLKAIVAISKCKPEDNEIASK